MLFVSHNMRAVRNLCTRALQLDGGRVVREGGTAEVVDAYLRLQGAEGARVEWEPGQGPGDESARLVAMAVLGPDGEPAQVVNSDQPFVVRTELDIERLDEGLCVGFDLTTADGTEVFRTRHNDDAPELWPRLEIGRNVLDCEIPARMLNEGRFLVVPRISIHTRSWVVEGEATVGFEVHRVPFESPLSYRKRPGPLAPLLPWRVAHDGLSRHEDGAQLGELLDLDLLPSREDEDVRGGD